MQNQDVLTMRAVKVAREWPHLLIVWTVVFAVYGLTMSHTVGLEDDGLFILSSHYAGIAHPPGYPLFSLIGHLFDMLPFGSIAFRIHLTSAFFGALACSALWWCVYLLVPGRAPAYAAAFTFAFSAVFWSQSIVAEVYSLNMLFFFLLLALCVQLLMKKVTGQITGLTPDKLIIAIALIGGLSLTNHWPLMVLAAPAYLVILWPVRFELVRNLHFMIPAFLLGISPYLWMVMRSHADPVASFYGPINSFSEFWFMISRKGYMGIDSSVTAGVFDKIQFAGHFIRDLLSQLTFGGFVLVAIGFARQFSYWDRRIATGLLLAFLCSSLFLIGMLGFDYDDMHIAMFRVYPLVAYGVMAVWIGLGLHVLAEFVRSGLDNRLSAGLISVLGAVLITAWSLAGNYSGNDRSNFSYPEEYARLVLDSLPKDSVLLLGGDIAFGSVSYLNILNSYRPDVTIYQDEGLVLSNRIFDPLSDTPQQKANKIFRFLEDSDRPVYLLTHEMPETGVDHMGLYSRFQSDLHGEPRYIFRQELFDHYQSLMRKDFPVDLWLQIHKAQLSHQFGRVLALSDLDDEQQLLEKLQTYPELTEGNIEGRLGLALGLISRGDNIYPDTLFRALQGVEALIDKNTSKRVLGLYLYASGVYFLSQGKLVVAEQFLENSVQTWPHRANGAFYQLVSLYGELGRAEDFQRIQEKIDRISL